MTYRPLIAFVIALIGLIGIAISGRAETRPDSVHGERPLRAVSLIGVAPLSAGSAHGWNENLWDAGTTHQRNRKSPLGAVLRSLGSTLVPVGAGLLMFQGERPTADWIGGATLASGLIAGPAAGHFYASNTGQAWRGIAVRGGALIGGGLITGVLASFAIGRDYPFGGEDRSDVAGVAAIVTLLTSGLVLGVRTLYDIAQADDAARTYNDEAGLAIRPHVNPIQRRAGLTLRWTF